MRKPNSHHLRSYYEYMFGFESSRVICECVFSARLTHKKIVIVYQAEWTRQRSLLRHRTKGKCVSAVVCSQNKNLTASLHRETSKVVATEIILLSQDANAKATKLDTRVTTAVNSSNIQFATCATSWRGFHS